MSVRNLSFSTRLFLTAVVFVIPLVLITYYLIKAENVNIDFGVQEKAGTLFQRPAEKLLASVIAHKLASSRGDSAALQSSSQKLDEALAEFKQAYEASSTTLDFTEAGLKKRGRPTATIATLEQSLKDIRSAPKGTEHQDMINTLRAMINHSGDTSNLILDPDLDSYYLMDVVLLALPQNQDRLQDVLVRTEEILKRQKVTAAEQIQIAVYSAMLKEADLARIVGSTQTSLNEDANFFGASPTLQKNLPEKLAVYKKSTEDFIALLDVLAEQGEPIPLKTLTQIGEKAITANFDFWHTGADELDALLDARIGTLTQARNRDFYLSLFSIVIALSFSVYIGRTLNANIQSILRSVQKLRSDAVSALQTSANLVEASDKVSDSTTKQSSAIQQTVATLSQINSMVERSVDNASRSSSVASNSHQVAGQGQQAVEEMTESMRAINDSNSHVMEELEKNNRRIAEIVKLISEIGTKTQLINDIVFQTRLLSFNASVEAARAGEHGKGFAVVAEEVGNLASMSGTAANEINEMLGSSITRVNSIVEETKKSVGALIEINRVKTSGGLSVAERCAEVLKQVVDNAESLNKMVEEITLAAKEQATGVQQISTAMNQVDQSVHQNAESARLTSEYATEFRQRAEQLTHIVTLLENEILGRRTSEDMNTYPSARAA